MAAAGKKRIGQILFEEGYLDIPQLTEALEKQRICCKDHLLGQILLNLGHITTRQLCDAVLIQTKY